jgi:putative ABC transport system substrate-binding protein
MINRHGVLSWLALSLFAAPRASAQTGARLARIGWLRSDAGKPLDDELRGALRELGWVEGRNLRIETRIADNPQRGREQAAELQALPVALIVAVSTPLIRAARDGAPATPIVMVNAADALGSGFVASLARPGGLLTGTTSAAEETLAKQLELLSSVEPRAKRIGVLMNPVNPANDFFFKSLSARARLLAMPLERIEVNRDSELDAAVARAKGGALLVVGDALFSRQRARIAALLITHRVPGMFVSREDVLAGGLMSYNTSSAWHIRRAAGYVDKILNGAKPGELPVRQPTHWELAINLKTAKALGITIPPSLLLRADEVIQ